MFFDKIRTHHLERKAILYIWQSFLIRFCITGRAALQYAMRDRLASLGWSEVEVIDDDLGHSAAGGVQRRL